MNEEVTEPTVETTEATEAPQSLIQPDAPAPDENKWYFDDGYEGTGEAPEWFKASKYKSVSEQAKAYTELEKKFGAFTGHPKDGYQLPEGLDKEDALVQEVMKFGEKYQMNQDGFNEMMNLAMEQAKVTEEISVENELAKLGDNAGERINRVTGFLKNNLEQEKFDELAPMMTTAESIKLAEAFIGLTTQSKLPIEEVVTSDGITMEQYTAELMKKDENGNFLINTSTEHKKKLSRWKAELESKTG